MVINARNQTTGAFQGVISNLRVMEQQLRTLSLWGITGPRLISAGFQVFGSSLNLALQNVARFTLGVGTHFQRLGLVYGQSANQLADALAKGTLQATPGVMMLIGQLRQMSQTYSSLSAGSALAFRSIGMLGAMLQPIMGILGGFLALGLQVFQLLGQAVLRLGEMILNVLTEAFHKLVAVALAAAAAIGAALFAIVKHGLEINMTFEGARAAFSTLMGSTEKAAEFTRKLRQEARGSAFDFVTLAQGAQQLMAFGIAGEKIIPMLRTLGDAAFIRGTEGAVERLNRLVLHIGQIQSEGVLHGRQARELMEMSIPVRQMLNIPMGIDFATLKISADRAIPAIIAGIEAKFGGLQEKMRFSTVFLLSALKDEWNDFAARVTDNFQTQWNQAISNLIRMFYVLEGTPAGQRISATLEAVISQVGALIVYLTSQIPNAIQVLDQFLSSRRWAEFTGFVGRAMHEVYDLMVNGINFIANHWSQIWPVIRDIAIGSIRVIAGGIGGLANVMFELISTHDGLKDMFISLGEVFKVFALIVVQTMYKVVMAMLSFQVITGIVQAIIGNLTGNAALTSTGIASIVSGTAAMGLATIMTLNIEKGIQDIDFDKIGAQIQAKFMGQAQKPGVVGAFVRGFLGVNSEIDKILAGLPGQGGVNLPTFTGDHPQFGGAMKSGSTQTLPEVLNQLMQKMLKDLLENLEAQSDAWRAIVGASKAYGATLGDHNAAVRLQLVANLGLLDALNRQKAVQMQVLPLQEAFSTEWFKTLEAVNKVAQGISDTQEEIRKILFDTTMLNQVAETTQKIFQLGKDAGFDADTMNQLGIGQLQTNMQTLLVERAKLSTMQRGTVEWYKQQGVIVDIIQKMVQMKKDLGEVNDRLATPLLRMPNSPYGIRGPGPEMGNIGGGGMGDFASSVYALLQFALNPPGVDLNDVASGVMGGANAPGGLPPGPAAAGENGSVGFNFNPSFNFNVGTINDAEEMKKLAAEFVDARLEETFKKMQGWGRDRNGR